MRTMLVTLMAIIFGLLATPAHAEKPTDAPRIVAFGDSITEGVGTKNPARESWPALIGAKRVARAGGCLVTEGCFGRNAAIGTYDRRVLPKRPDAVIVAYGINDLISGASSTPEIVKGIRSLVRENRALGIKTYVATVTPVRMEIDFDPTRVEFNKAVRAAFPADRIIDFDRALVGPNGNLPRRFDSGDGIHPNGAGYRVMARTAASVIGN